MTARGPITRPTGPLLYAAAVAEDEDFWIERVRPKDPPDLAETEKDTAYVVAKLWDAVRRSQEENRKTSPKETTT